MKFQTKIFRRGCCCGIIILLLLYNILPPISDLIYAERKFFQSEFFVNTSGCRMLALEPFNRDIIPLWENLKPDRCINYTLFTDSSDYEHNYLVLYNKKETLKHFEIKSLKKLKCKYFAVERFNDNSNRNPYFRDFKVRPKMKLKIEPHADIVRVECRSDSKAYKKVHFFIRPPQPVVAQVNHTKPLSIMILGIDSVSHMHFLRSMPLTTDYMQQLPHVEFWGYNRVGINSFPNLMPLLSGLSAEQIKSSCMRNSFDDCKFIWQHYKAAGYQTSLGEDSMIIGTFNYNKPGFQSKPTDYYLRNIMADMFYHTKYTTILKSYCNSEQSYAEVLWEFFYRLLPHFKCQNFFSFFWWTQGVHDRLNYAKLWDIKFLEMLQQLQVQGILNKTLVLLMGDHGLRFGDYRKTYTGMLEESQPVLFALYPKWLQQQYPLALKNLQNNAHRLVTNYDLHETLKDLLNLQHLAKSNVLKRVAQLKALGQNISRGISLFLPIPELRDCELAAIPNHFCLCHRLQQISIDEVRVKIAATFMVNSINLLLKNETKCRSLKLEKLLSAYAWRHNDSENELEILVKAVTTPGLGEFEATIRFTGYSVALDGPITRTNEYGKQSHCIKNYLIEMYCYCVVQLKNGQT